jgi:seipin
MSWKIYIYAVPALIGELRALPGVVTSNIHRGVHLCRPCICVVCVCAARLCSYPALGRAVEEPVTVRQPLYFDYTEAQPSAAVTLSGALERECGAAGWTLLEGVSLVLLLPDSYHNREVGMFQVHVHAYYMIRDPKF